MIVFMDTSSLLKLYHEELGTAELLVFLSQDIESIYLSELAILEFCSAIWKKTRTGEITVNAATAAITCFQNDFVKFQWIPIDNLLIQQAQVLLMKYGSAGLRTLDAIQLASAFLLNERKLDVCCLSADKLLQSFFTQEELLTCFS